MTLPPVLTRRKASFTVEGERVRLRSPVASDYAAWAALRAESRTHLTPWEPTWSPDELTRESFRRRLSRYRQAEREGAGYMFFIFAEPALKLADYMAELSRFLPPELVSAAAQTSDVTASNVPGVPVPVWLAGARVERMYPLVGTIGSAINVTMLTYDGVASVGISSDDAAITDRKELIASLRHGFAEVIGADALTGDPLSR
jgi:hypothetical protein